MFEQSDKLRPHSPVFIGALVGFFFKNRRKTGTNTMVREATKLAVDAGIWAIPSRSNTKLQQIMAARTALRSSTRPFRPGRRRKNTVDRMINANPEVMVM